MATRMQRYRDKNECEISRASRNEDLYRTMYEIDFDDTEYSNTLEIRSIGNKNGIDISKLKEELKSREDYQKQKEYRKIMNFEEEVSDTPILEDDSRVYDIRDVLDKAKSNRSLDNERVRSLKNPQYNALQNSNIDILSSNRIKYEELKEENEELRELINTITSTSMLNKLKDDELSLGLLDNGDTVSSNKTLTSKLDLEEDHLENTTTMEQSFFTSNLGLSKKDFQDYDEFSEENKTSSFASNILMIGLACLVIVALLFIILGKLNLG